ncbi:hypothetical protein DFS34DRAFT_1054 [Phlyctochytrium arcticum]|nr:hypothetical protein DFS34DRAFT_1054 [Phlyctochytrium arcticum]
MSTAQRIYCQLLRCIQRPRCSSISFTGNTKVSDRSFLTKAERTAFILTGKALPSSARPSKAPRTNKDGLRRAEEEGLSRHTIHPSSIRRAQGNDLKANITSGKQADAHRPSPDNSSTKQGKSEVAEDLVRRHTGAAGTEVYGTLISGLGRQGRHKNVIQAFKEMKGRRLKPSPQVHTSLLSSMARAAFGTSDDLAKTNRFREALQLWETINSKELPHLNAMLNVCAACVSVGGWEYGCLLYNQSRSGSRLPKPDIVTITTFFRLCAERKGDEGRDAALGVWDDLRRLPLPHTDARLLSMFHLACVRGGKKVA